MKNWGLTIDNFDWRGLTFVDVPYSELVRYERKTVRSCTVHTVFQIRDVFIPDPDP
jgi:hypothetical protein